MDALYYRRPSESPWNFAIKRTFPDCSWSTTPPEEFIKCVAFQGDVLIDNSTEVKVDAYESFAKAISLPSDEAFDFRYPLFTDVLLLQIQISKISAFSLFSKWLFVRRIDRQYSSRITQNCVIWNYNFPVSLQGKASPQLHSGYVSVFAFTYLLRIIEKYAHRRLKNSEFFFELTARAKW